MLVADALRLGGAILAVYPNMLAPQLVGRVKISELRHESNPLLIAIHFIISSCCPKLAGIQIFACYLKHAIGMDQKIVPYFH